MQPIRKKAVVATFLFISLFVALSGCTDLFNLLREYVPTVTPGPEATHAIGESVPASIVKDVTITGSGNTITIKGRGPYNVNSHVEYINLNRGNADISIKLKGQGFGCFISVDYTNPYTGSTEMIKLHEFTAADRTYELSKQVSLPYTTRYCLMVDWGGDWEIRIAQ